PRGTPGCGEVLDATRDAPVQPSGGDRRGAIPRVYVSRHNVANVHHRPDVCELARQPRGAVRGLSPGRAWEVRTQSWALRVATASAVCGPAAEGHREARPGADDEGRPGRRRHLVLGRK